MRGSVIKRGSTWTYVVDVGRDPVSGRRRQKWKGGFATRHEAENALAVAVAGTASGVVEPTGMTVAEYLEQWLTGHTPTLKPTTAKSYQEIVRWWVIPSLGSARLADLGPLHVQTLYGDLLTSGGKKGQGLSPSSVASVHRVLRKAMNDAMQWGLLARNPLAGVKQPRSADREVQAWSFEEARRFLGHVRGDRWEALWVLAITTGMRRAEIAGLRWKDVDLDKGKLAVRNTRVSVKYDVFEHEPKTRRSRRMIDLGEQTVAVLRSHRRRQIEERLAWGPAYVDSGYVFTAENGEAMHPERFTVMFEQLTRQLDVPRIRAHDLRHTCASLWLAAGVHPKIVSERLGHSSIAITLDRYSHVIPGLQAEAAEKLGTMILGNGLSLA